MLVVHPAVGLIIAIVVAGCTEAIPEVERDASAPLQTSDDVFEFDDNGSSLFVSIPVQFTNLTGGDVFFITCNRFVPHGVERLVNGQWERFWGPNLSQCLDWPPQKLAAGESRLDTVAVYGDYKTESYPRAPWLSNLPGVFRLRVDNVFANVDESSGGWDHESELPEEARVSNAFVLHK